MTNMLALQRSVGNRGARRVLARATGETFTNNGNDVVVLVENDGGWGKTLTLSRDID